MEILINGREKRLETPLNLSGLLALLELEPQKIAVERNLEIVPKSLYEDTELSDGDRIEIVQFVGGG